MKICPKCNIEHTMNGKFCSKKCGNSRTWTPEINARRSAAVSKHHEIHGHPQLGTSGWKPTEEQKEVKRQRTIEHWDKIGRKTENEKRAKNAELVKR